MFRPNFAGEKSTCVRSVASRLMSPFGTTAFGVRRYAAERRKLKRELRTVRTPFGEVTVKLGRLDGRVVQAAPEYESCRAVAEAAHVPVKQVYEAAVKAWET